jgi:hypothetical protein
MTRMRRACAVGPLFVVSLFMAIALVTTSTSAPALSMAALRQATPTAPFEVGAGPVAERAFTVVARNVYGPKSVQLLGFLTEVIGLDAEALFTGGPVSEETARFTYTATVPNPSTASKADVTEIAGIGSLQIFLDDDGGAAWGDPASFADGQLVAEFSLGLHDTVHRQAPGIGVVVGDEVLRQISGGEFSLDGGRFRFGGPDIAQRLRYTGVVIGDGEQAVSTALTGTSRVTTRETIPASLGIATPAASTPPGSACLALEPWLGATTGALALAQSLTAAAVVTSLENADAQALQQAANAVADLATAQRVIEVPATAADANRLVVTALSTFARGLQVQAGAVIDADEERLAQAQAILADADGLTRRAGEALAAVAGSCLANGGPEAPAS